MQIEVQHSRRFFKLPAGIATIFEMGILLIGSVLHTVALGKILKTSQQAYGSFQVDLSFAS